MCFVLSLLHIPEFHWSNPGMDYLGIGKGKPATNFEAACERTGPGRAKCWGPFKSKMICWD